MFASSLLCLATAAISGQTVIAVLDVRGRAGVPSDLTMSITDLLVSEVQHRQPGSRVLDADELRSLLGQERPKSKASCSSVHCLAELGTAVGAQEVVAGTVGKLGSGFALSLQLVDATRAQVVASSSRNVDPNDAAGLLQAVRAAVAEILPGADAPAPDAGPADPWAQAQHHALEDENPEPLPNPRHLRGQVLAQGGLVVLGDPEPLLAIGGGIAVPLSRHWDFLLNGRLELQPNLRLLYDNDSRSLYTAYTAVGLSIDPLFRAYLSNPSGGWVLDFGPGIGALSLLNGPSPFVDTRLVLETGAVFGDGHFEILLRLQPGLIVGSGLENPDLTFALSLLFAYAF